MINIRNKVTYPLSRDTLNCLNQRCLMPLNKDTVKSLNMQKSDKQQTQCLASALNQPMIQKTPDIVIPALQHPLRKGQKTSLSLQGRQISEIKARFGWNITDACCDMDVSAFLVTERNIVLGEDWFIFYNQTASPDSSVRFSNDVSQKDREIISIDFRKLNPAVKKIVFVLTINEAFERNLNFSMVKDAYIRLIDAGTNQEIVSYKLEEFYSNVTSMTIGELYLHNGQWKFNPVGNGVYQDLAGQCKIYGVEIG